jgi:hypothetical protein
MLGGVDLSRVLDDLGTTLLELVCGDAGRGGAIGGVAIHDPVEEPVLPHHALVLGVGLRDRDDIVALLRSLKRHEAAGLVIRAPVPMSDEIAAAVGETGVAVIALTRGASWAQLAALLRTLLGEGEVAEGRLDTLGGMPTGDLFALANAVAALVDAPVTIEDRSSRVLAFSGRQDEADPGRVQTILGRQVPDQYSQLFTHSGVFRDLYRSEHPVYIEPPEGDDEFRIPRVAVAIRAGSEVLGSIWAAVHEPLSPDRSDALRDAAKLVALHLLHNRAGEDAERRLRTDLLSAALEGGPGARDALDRLRLADQPVVVLALAALPCTGAEAAEPPGAGTDASLAAERQQLGDAFAIHLSAVHARSAVALIGDTVYGLLPVPAASGDGEPRALRIVGGFLERVGDRIPAGAGVGPVAHDAAGLAAARISADRALRVVRARAGGRLRVARLEDVHAEALLLELRDLGRRADGAGGAAARVRRAAQHQPGRDAARLARRVRRRDRGRGGDLRAPQHVSVPVAAPHRGGRHRSDQSRRPVQRDAAAARAETLGRQQP